jgi:hypothetical protein
MRKRRFQAVVTAPFLALVVSLADTLSNGIIAQFPGKF